MANWHDMSYEQLDRSAQSDYSEDPERGAHACDDIADELTRRMEASRSIGNAGAAARAESVRQTAMGRTWYWMGVKAERDRNKYERLAR